MLSKYTLSVNFQLGTHDIVGVAVESSPLLVRAEYVTNSTAAGGIFVFLFVSGDGNTVTDFSKSLFVCLDRSTSSSGHVLTSQLPPGEYFVSAYDIKENGRLNTGLVLPADTTIHSQAGTTASK